MSAQVLERTVVCSASAEETLQWLVRPGAARRLMPPWERVRAGNWAHRYEVGSTAEGTSILTDHVDYELPMGGIGQFLGGRAVRSRFERTFAWRHRVMLHDLQCHAAAAARGFTGKRIAITGASGLVGSSLGAFLRTGGHQVLELVRHEPRAPHEVRWSPTTGEVDHARLEGVDAIVHLAGEPIFGLRWTEEKKRRIVQSRVQGTRTIVDAIGRLEKPPAVFVSASAVGWYGDRGDEKLTEEASMGEGFLAETCAAWEAEADGVQDGVRGVKLRLGVVLDAGGGALKMMLPGFTKTLGRVLGRPTRMPVPSFGLKAALGKEQAQEMLLASVRVVPAALAGC